MLTAGLGIWAAITIAVAGPVTSPEYLPVHVAQAEGYFAQEKLDVTLKVERSEGDAARALARGQADLTATSIDTAYGQGHVGGEPPLLLFGLTAAPPVAIVVSPSHRASIRSLADLRGQPVGLPGAGTPEHAMLTSVLSHAGIRIQQVPVHSYGLLRLAGALEQGQVAAAVLGDPWVTRLAGEGGGVLADLRTRAGARRWLGAETVHAAVFVRPDSKLSERELMAVARALLRAVARLSEGSPEARKSSKSTASSNIKSRSAPPRARLPIASGCSYPGSTTSRFPKPCSRRRRIKSSPAGRQRVKTNSTASLGSTRRWLSKQAM